MNNPLPQNLSAMESGLEVVNSEQIDTATVTSENLAPSQQKKHSVYYGDISALPEFQASGEKPQATRGVRKIFGGRQGRSLEKRGYLFRLVVVLAILLVVAAIAGGVGGSIAVKNAKKSKAENNIVATQVVTITPLTPATTPAASASTSIPGPASSTINGIFAPPAPTSISAINVTCPEWLYVDKPSRFKAYDYVCSGTSDDVGDELTGIIAYDIDVCLGACITFNEVKGEDTCKGVVLFPDLGKEWADNRGANCWLKSSHNVVSGRATVVQMRTV